jgi:hypothetical protein
MGDCHFGYITKLGEKKKKKKKKTQSRSYKKIYVWRVSYDKGILVDFFLLINRPILTFVYLPTPLCQIRTLPKFSRQHYHVSIPKLPTQHNSARSAFSNCQLNTTAPGRHSQIANSTQQRQVGIPKLPTQHSYFCQIAKSTSPLWTTQMSFKLPTN